jgi:hypothetical protein
MQFDFRPSTLSEPGPPEATSQVILGGYTTETAMDREYEAGTAAENSAELSVPR